MMTGFSSPNHTQVPNDLFDVMLCQMSETELRIVLFAIRQTLGFHRGSDQISLSQFMKATGLSRQGVLDGIEAAMKRGVLQQVGQGKRGTHIYQLVYSVDQSNQQTSTGQHSRPDIAPTGLLSRHTKEKEKETSQKKGGARQTKTAETLSVLVARVKEHPIWKAFNAGYDGHAPEPTHQDATRHLGWIAELEQLGATPADVESTTRAQYKKKRVGAYILGYVAADINSARSVKAVRSAKPQARGIWANKSAAPAAISNQNSAAPLQKQAEAQREALRKRMHLGDPDLDRNADERAS